MKTLALLPTNFCLHCQEELKGRSDKKFCDYHCRNAYNNMRQVSDDSLFKSYSKIIRKNRAILKELWCLKASGEELKIRRDALLRRGFSFEAITGFQFRDEAGRDAMFQVAEFRYRLRASQVVILLENSGEASAA